MYIGPKLTSNKKESPLAILNIELLAAEARCRIKETVKDLMHQMPTQVA